VPFSTRITVPFGDTDLAGLVYFPNILSYCHVAMERFFSEYCGTPYSDLVQRQFIGFPTVKLEAEFLVPIGYGDEISVEVRISRVGRNSVTLLYNLSRESDEVLCARATLIHVAMDLRSRRSLSIPDELRTALLRNDDGSSIPEVQDSASMSETSLNK
jgi:4-hydroxybenzoyl-CoA thioesterase